MTRGGCARETSGKEIMMDSFLSPAESKVSFTSFIFFLITNMTHELYIYDLFYKITSKFLYNISRSVDPKLSSA